MNTNLLIMNFTELVSHRQPARLIEILIFSFDKTIGASSQKRPNNASTKYECV